MNPTFWCDVPPGARRIGRHPKPTWLLRCRFARACARHGASKHPKPNGQRSLTRRAGDNLVGWLGVVIYAVLAEGYAYFRFIRPAVS